MTNNLPVDPASCTLNVHAIVKFFGAPTELARLLKKHGICDITPAAIDKWQLRGQIPGMRLMHIQTLASRMGRRFSLGHYIKRPRKPRAKKEAA